MPVSLPDTFLSENGIARMGLCNVGGWIVEALSSIVKGGVKQKIDKGSARL